MDIARRIGLVPARSFQIADDPCPTKLKTATHSFYVPAPRRSSRKSRYHFMRSVFPQSHRTLAGTYSPAIVLGSGLEAFFSCAAPHTTEFLAGRRRFAVSGNARMPRALPASGEVSRSHFRREPREFPGRPRVASGAHYACSIRRPHRRRLKTRPGKFGGFTTGAHGSTPAGAIPCLARAHRAACGLSIRHQRPSGALVGGREPTTRIRTTFTAALLRPARHRRTGEPGRRRRPRVMPPRHWHQLSFVPPLTCAKDLESLAVASLAEERIERDRLRDASRSRVVAAAAKPLASSSTQCVALSIPGGA